MHLAPFTYYGSKGRMLQWLGGRLPPATAFVDLFGGSGVVSLHLSHRYNKVIYNDLHGRLYNFFKVLREECDTLCELLACTPSSRKELASCYEQHSNHVEDARRVFVLINQSFANDGINKNKPRWQTPSATNLVSRYSKRKDMLPIISRIIRTWNLENRDFEFVLKKYDKPDVLFFADPPYDLSARKASGYLHEFDEPKHRLLASMLHECKGKAVVCGYHSDLYDSLYASWECHEHTVNCNSASGAIGKASQATKRTECLWVKPST